MSDISLRKQFDYSSSLYRFLCQYPENDLFYTSHNPILEHPADALRKALKNTYKVLKQLSEVDKESYDDCKECIREVFNQVDSFYDICFEILKCFFDQSNKKNIKNNKDWLKENKINCVNIFTSNVDTHSKFVSEINNLTKHNTWNFESFTFLYNKQIAIPSFYFGTVLHDKSIGPNQDIHKKWHGFQTGFSYDFIIRKLIAHIFLYQEKLFKCLQTTFPHIKLTAEKVNEQHLNKDLFELAFNTTINFLPNEYELPSGIFIKQNNNYLIQYPKNQRNKQPKLISWEINYNIETNPRTNKISGVLPYFQNIKPKQ